MLPDVLVDLARAQRGSIALITERTRSFGTQTCEACRVSHPGGTARGVVVYEHDESDTVWLLWMFADGFSVSDESANGPIALCEGSSRAGPPHASVRGTIGSRLGRRAALAARRECL
jgi:hypothetical protein